MEFVNSLANLLKSSNVLEPSTYDDGVATPLSDDGELLHSFNIRGGETLDINANFVAIPSTNSVNDGIAAADDFT